MARSFPNRNEPGARALGPEYELPPELIAAHPAARPRESRLLVYHRADDRVEHRHFYDLPDYIGPDDLLVLTTRRCVQRRDQQQRSTEVLLLEETSPRHWVALVKPGARAKPGMRLLFLATRADGSGNAGQDIGEAGVLKTLPAAGRSLPLSRRSIST